MKRIMVGAMLLSIVSSGFNMPTTFGKSEEYNKSDIVQSNISKNIQGVERQVIAQAMEGLEIEDQENVIYVAGDGTVYANKPELKNEVEKFKKISENVFEDSQGNRYALPAQTERPTTSPFTVATSTYTQEDETDIGVKLAAPYPTLSGGTGPYRRVFSKPSYSWSSAYVYLPGGTNIKDSNGPGQNGDAGFVYLGGWGRSGSAVDAGFIHGSTYSDWAPMIQINGNALGQTVRLAEAQNVYLKFLVPANDKIAMAFSGIQKSTGTQISRTYIYDVSGFSVSGGNIMKRMTTIGQSVENFKTGSYIKNVHWYNTNIGLSDSSYHPWTSVDQATDSYSGYHSYPDSTKVTVNFVNAGEETDSIVLQ